MIHEKARQLIEDIFSEVNHPDIPDEIKKEPEVFLLSLLNNIKGELKGVAKFRAILYRTVESASFESSRREAREQLEEISAKK